MDARMADELAHQQDVRTEIEDGEYAAYIHEMVGDLDEDLRRDVSYLTSKARLIRAHYGAMSEDEYYEHEAEMEAERAGSEWFDAECGWQSDAEGVAL